MFLRNFDHPCTDGLKNGTSPLFSILPTEPLRPKLTVTSAALAAALARSSLLAFLTASASVMSMPSFFRVAMYSQSLGYISTASFALDSRLFLSLPALSALSMSMNVDCEIPASLSASEQGPPVLRSLIASGITEMNSFDCLELMMASGKSRIPFLTMKIGDHSVMRFFHKEATLENESFTVSIGSSTPPSLPFL